MRTFELVHANGFNSPNINLPNVASSGLTLASDGNLYGLRVGSVLYRITPAGKYHEIGPVSPTQFIDGGLIQASDGNFWGSFFGVPGVVFTTTPNESFLEDIRFARDSGAEPFGPIQAADGKLYGMSFMNGAPENGQPTNGSFWVIDAGLPPPQPQIINFQPTAGAAGSTILIQGSHFVGTSGVTINGISAKFKVLTANFIRVTVPAGASTGKISITNAGGAMTSATNFTVQ